MALCNNLEDGAKLNELAIEGLPTIVPCESPFANTVSHAALLHNRR